MALAKIVEAKNVKIVSSFSQPVEPLPTPWPLSRIPGISAADQSALKKVGIESTQHLLDWGSTAAQRQALSTQLKIPLRFIHKWVALADLAQIPSATHRCRERWGQKVVGYCYM